VVDIVSYKNLETFDILGIFNFHPYRPVWYVPDQGMDYTMLYRVAGKGS